MKNVLLITADQWRGDCLGIAGHPLVKTPNLDYLASQGVRFAQHYAGATPCSPARACLYTGLYQMNNRVCMNGTPLDNRHDTIALGARRAGYDPMLFGYTDQSVDPRFVHHNDPSLATYEEILPGFNPQQRINDDSASWLGWLKRQGFDKSLLDANTIHYPTIGLSDEPVQIPPVYSADQTQTAFITESFLDWLDEHPYTTKAATTGWFAHVSFLRPHPPFCVPEPYNSMIKSHQVPDFSGSRDWETLSQQHPYLAFEFDRIAKSSFLPGLTGLVREWDDNALKTIAAIYFCMIAEVDAQIGRIITELKDRDFWDNTIIVFTSDHGELLGDHCQLGKSGFYDQSYHIPLIIRAPEMTQHNGLSHDSFTEAVDLFPTLMSLLNQAAPSQLDGKSLAPFLAGNTPNNWRKNVHWEYDFRDIDKKSAEQYFNMESQVCNLSVIRNRQYKYVHFAALPPLLFDLKDDPSESNNVADDDAYLSIRLNMAEQLLTWRAQHLDQTLALTKNKPREA